jgi:hypothetical protein
MQKATPTKAGKAASRRAPAAAAQAAAGTRAYRRMPDPEQVMDAYRQTGTIGGVAEHFNVPRHTVAGWAANSGTAHSRRQGRTAWPCWRMPATPLPRPRLAGVGEAECG